MDKNKDILSDWKRRTRPTIPTGFFDRFVEELMQRIEQESGILGQLKKAEKPELPEGYFDAILADLTPEKEDFTLDQLKKNKLPTLPLTYFEDSTDKIMELVSDSESKTKKKGRIIPMRVVTAVISVAAVLAIIFTVVDFSDDEIKPTVIVETEEDTYDTYLTYLDESEIIDYIIDNDINIEDSTTTVQYDDYSDFSEEDIEDFYLDDIDFL